MNLTILQSVAKPKRVVLVDPGYPYGKQKVYMSGSLIGITAQLMAAGHEVDVVDFNIDRLNDSHAQELFSHADYIGISLVGSPAIPQVARLLDQLSKTYPEAQMLLGGQVVGRLSSEQFKKIFGSDATQISRDMDIAPFMGNIPSVYETSFIPVWERMGDTRLKNYISREFGLVLSQGCIYSCKFCSAQKGQKETFRNLDIFHADLLFLLRKAKQFGIEKMECYASSLDFFQTPKSVFTYMEAMAEAQEETGVRLAVRCLACMNTFLAASEQRKDFRELVQRSGLWCIGFGVDGPTEETWKEQNKTQNSMEDIEAAYNLALCIGLRSEVLTVIGHPGDTPRRLLLTVKQFSRFMSRWPNAVLRPYVARTVLPGNDGWIEKPEIAEQLTRNPQLFYNLDICGLANSITHPNRWQRWLVNLAYIAVILRFAPFDRCATSPLLPQGESGFYGRIARLVNRHMPFDR
jgi:hypothetical protein